MSEKKAFMLYLDYKQHLELLTDAERGMLMMALFDYAADNAHWIRRHGVLVYPGANGPRQPEVRGKMHNKPGKRS